MNVRCRVVKWKQSFSYRADGEIATFFLLDKQQDSRLTIIRLSLQCIALFDNSTIDKKEENTCESVSVKAGTVATLMGRKEHCTVKSRSFLFSPNEEEDFFGTRTAINSLYLSEERSRLSRITSHTTDKYFLRREKPSWQLIRSSRNYPRQNAVLFIAITRRTGRNHQCILENFILRFFWELDKNVCSAVHCRQNHRGYSISEQSGCLLGHKTMRSICQSNSPRSV